MKLIFTLFLVILFENTSAENAQPEMDAIALLASCGHDCWNKENPKNDTVNINPEQPLDGKLVKCMQVCFSERTKQEDNEENLPLEQVKKIKVSAYCGFICYPNNKKTKKALDFCYAGCLGTLLQPRKA